MTAVNITTAKVSDMTEDQLQAFIERTVNQRLADWLHREADTLDLANSYTWEQIRQQCPNVWVLIETLDAFTDKARGKRIIPHMRLIQAFEDDWRIAWAAYKETHHADLDREYYILHTIRETLDIGVLDPFRRRLDAR
ncbi:MAG: hypothetical protein ACYDBJ_11070 [Aggregatilineales bacterium]